jgi:uncharacterized protein
MLTYMSTPETELLHTGRSGERSRPFIHRFRTHANHYVYDVNLNSIVRVTPVEYAIVKDYGSLSFEDIASRYAARFSVNELKAAHLRIARMHTESGYFSSQRFHTVLYPLDERPLQLIYEGQLRGLTLEVTEQCNLRCAYCTHSGTYKAFRPHSTRHMSFALARKAIDLFHTHSKLSDSVSIGFYGGEPLLMQTLLEQCMDYASTLFARKRLTFRITTNGLLLNHRACKTLIEHDVQVLVSIDGPRELHDRYRRDTRGTGSFTRLYSALERLHAMDAGFYRANVSFNFVLAPPYDFKTLHDFVSNSPLLMDNHIMAEFVSPGGTTWLRGFRQDELAPGAYYKCMEAKLHAEIISGRRNPLAPEDKAMKLAHCLFGKELDRYVAALHPTPPFAGFYHPGGTCLPGQKKLLVSCEGKLVTCEKANSNSAQLCIGSVNSGIDVAKCMAIIRDFSNLHQLCGRCIACRCCEVCFVHADCNGLFDAAEKERQCKGYIALFKRLLVNITTIGEGNPEAFQYIRQIAFAG